MEKGTSSGKTKHELIYTPNVYFENRIKALGMQESRFCYSKYREGY